MKPLSPEMLFTRLLEEVPHGYHRNLIVVGSLAAAYHFREQIKDRAVRTKDAGLLLVPHDEAQESGQKVATHFRRLGWEPRLDGRIPSPTPEPTENLPGIRLYPPHSTDYFIEFLMLPESEKARGKRWFAIQQEDGYYGLCSFEFMSLVAQKPHKSSIGIFYARPCVMALANLLSHPEIRPEAMSSPYGNKMIKRSNKDLGRVLSLAWLDDENLDKWGNSWKLALQNCFPTRGNNLITTVDSGLKALLARPEDLEEAWYTCDVGLLNGQNVSVYNLKVTAERLLQEVVEVAQKGT